MVEPELLQLVKLRNQAARQLKFKNYHELKLYLNEQDGKELVPLFDKLDNLTRGPFEAAKAEIDAKLAADCGIKTQELMPWHYHDPFFQESPNVFSANLDSIYADQDLIQLVRVFYRSIDLPVDRVIEKTGDFAPHKGKNPHAFCIDLTRDGSDVRVLANVAQDDYWMSTLLHEFGHSVYSSINIPEKLPYVLRMESHILTTEGVAMMFERLTKRRAWLEKMGVKVADPKSFDETASKMQRAAADLLALVPGHAALREEHVRKPQPGSQQTMVGHGRALPASQTAGGTECAGLRQQDPHRDSPRLLPQLHAGRDVRFAIAPGDCQGRVRRGSGRIGRVCRQQGCGPLYVRKGFRPGPDADVEWADAFCDGGGSGTGGVCEGFSGEIEMLADDHQQDEQSLIEPGGSYPI